MTAAPAFPAGLRRIAALSTVDGASASSSSSSSSSSRAPGSGAGEGKLGSASFSNESGGGAGASASASASAAGDDRRARAYLVRAGGGATSTSTSRSRSSSSRSSSLDGLGDGATAAGTSRGGEEALGDGGGAPLRSRRVNVLIFFAGGAGERPTSALANSATASSASTSRARDGGMTSERRDAAAGRAGKTGRARPEGLFNFDSVSSSLSTFPRRSPPMRLSDARATTSTDDNPPSVARRV